MTSGMADFAGRAVLVTGATGGIGAANVRRLVGQGASVYAGGRDIVKLARLCGETGAQPVPFDLSSEDEIRAAVSGLDLWGVVNCGGFGGEIATPEDTDIAVFDKVISVNARGSLRSEERRVGKGGRSRGETSQYEQKQER